MDANRRDLGESLLRSSRRICISSCQYRRNANGGTQGEIAGSSQREDIEGLVEGDSIGMVESTNWPSSRVRIGPGQCQHEEIEAKVLLSISERRV